MGLLDIFRRKKKDKAIMEKPDEKKKSSAVRELKRLTAKKEEKKEAAKGKKKKLKEDTKDAYKVLVRPLVTEKSTMMGTYHFVVNPKTNKQEVKKAIEALYGVTPIKVNIMNFGGKNVRWGRTRGRTRAWKKAIVTLRAGDKIEMFEGV